MYKITLFYWCFPNWWGFFWVAFFFFFTEITITLGSRCSVMLHNICRTKKQNKTQKTKNCLELSSHTRFARVQKWDSLGTSHFQKGIPSMGILKGWEGKGRGGTGAALFLATTTNIHSSVLPFIHPSIHPFSRRASRQQLVVISAGSCSDLTCRQPRTFKVPERTNAQPVTHNSLILKSPAKVVEKGEGVAECARKR